MNQLSKMVMVVMAAVIVVAFFLPWVSVESEAIGGVTKILTGKRQATIDSISGFKVPILANSDESRFMISIIKIFNPKITNADKKSFLVWGIPGLAVVMLIVAWFFENNKWAHLAMGIIGGAIFFVALYKIMTTDLDKLVLKVTIGYGLWLVLMGYLGIGIVSLIRFITLLKKA